MKTFREYLSEDKDKNTKGVNESILLSKLTDSEIKEFIGFLTTNTKNITKDIKTENIINIINITNAYVNGLKVWVDKMNKSRID